MEKLIKVCLLLGTAQFAYADYWAPNTNWRFSQYLDLYHDEHPELTDAECVAPDQQGAMFPLMNTQIKAHKMNEQEEWERLRDDHKSILHGEFMRLSCEETTENGERVKQYPSFKELKCEHGVLFPPGLKNTEWSIHDWNAYGLNFTLSCQKMDEIPAPGIKKGASMWRHRQTGNIMSNFLNNPDIGWWYNWYPNVPKWLTNGISSLTDKDDAEHLRFWPQISWMGYSKKKDQRNIGLKDYSENYLGTFNEPYGTGQANMTFQEIVKEWDVIRAKRQQLADRKGVQVQDIKVGSPTTGPGKKAMKYQEQLWPILKAQGITDEIDYLVVHSYTTARGGSCDAIQLRDEMYHMRIKFGKPIWLTEWNCGNGYWKNPEQDHYDYMEDALKELKVHPFVVRYNWFSALGAQSGNGPNLVDPNTYELTRLGERYLTSQNQDEPYSL
jgi:hypothetical protein